MQDSLVNQTRVLLIPLKVARSCYEKIEWNAQSSNLAVEQLCGPSPMDALRHDDQQIKIAARPHLASGCRAEQDDSERMDQIDDAGYQLINDGCRRFHTRIIPRLQPRSPRTSPPR